VLTYYSMLAVFPGLLVLVAGLSLFGGSATSSVIDGIESMTFGPTQQIITDWIASLQAGRRQAGIVAAISLVVAFYSAAGYVGAFMRAANAIYDVPEGRPVWKTLPLRFLITIVTGLFLAFSTLVVVFTGRLATQVGQLFGIAPGRIRVFDIAKWPLLALAFGLLIALLYWAAPNARQGGFRWITPGSLLATLVWVAASGGFAYYVSHFDSYNQTYGTLGGVIIFLVWMWLTNVAVLIGAEFDAELARERAIASGLPPLSEPYLPLRDVPKQEVVQSHPDI
jgi:membrane protein